jgi:hypothetical protein
VSIVSTVVVACLAVVFLGANLVYVLRPIALPGAPAADVFGSRISTAASTPRRQTGAGTPGWARRHHSTLLSLSRGTLNGSVATFGLIQVGHPVGASIAEGMTAGFLSGFFQLTVMNERFSSYLHRAGSEVMRVVKWAWFQALFYGLVKAAGTIAGGGPGDLGTVAVAYAVTITFGSAQYPWEAAIAARRALRTEQGGRRDGIRYVADLQTMAVSVTCVGVSILNSVGVPGSRLFLAAVGVAGLAYYALVRLRRELWRRDAGWSAIALLAGPERSEGTRLFQQQTPGEAAPRPLRLPARWRPARIRSLGARVES